MIRRTTAPPSVAKGALRHIATFAGQTFRHDTNVILVVQTDAGLRGLSLTPSSSMTLHPLDHFTDLYTPCDIAVEVL